LHGIGVAVEHAFQPSPDLRYRIMHLPAKLLVDFLQLLSPSIAVGNPPAGSE